MLLQDRNSEEGETTSVKRSTEKALQIGIWSWMLGNELRDEQKDKMMTCIWGRWAMVTKEEKRKCTGLFRRQWITLQSQRPCYKSCDPPVENELKSYDPCSPYYVAISFLLHRTKRKKNISLESNSISPILYERADAKSVHRSTPSLSPGKPNPVTSALMEGDFHWKQVLHQACHIMIPLQRRYRKGPIMEA